MKILSPCLVTPDPLLPCPATILILDDKGGFLPVLSQHPAKTEGHITMLSYTVTILCSGAYLGRATYLPGNISETVVSEDLLILSEERQFSAAAPFRLTPTAFLIPAIPTLLGKD